MQHCVLTLPRAFFLLPLTMEDLEGWGVGDMLVLFPGVSCDPGSPWGRSPAHTHSSNKTHTHTRSTYYHIASMILITFRPKELNLTRLQDSTFSTSRSGMKCSLPLRLTPQAFWRFRMCDISVFGSLEWRGSLLISEKLCSNSSQGCHHNSWPIWQAVKTKPGEAGGGGALMSHWRSGLECIVFFFFFASYFTCNKFFFKKEPRDTPKINVQKKTTFVEGDYGVHTVAP